MSMIRGFDELNDVNHPRSFSFSGLQLGPLGDRPIIWAAEKTGGLDERER